MGKHKKLVMGLFLLVIGMFGFGFALVPIYNSLCKSLGINGKVTQANGVYAPTNTDIVYDREVTVEFVATNSGGVPWDFYPKIRKIKVHPGEIAKLAFYAENKTDHGMTVQAIPSITPGIAAKYLKKKPSVFVLPAKHWGPMKPWTCPCYFIWMRDLPKKIQTITLAYALFDVTGKKISL